MSCSVVHQSAGGIKLVAFYTEYSHLVKNKLFSSSRPPGSYPVKPFIELRNAFELKGCTLITFDLLSRSAKHPDVIIFLDLPSSPFKVEAIRQAYPCAKIGLYVLESPAHSISQGNKKTFLFFDFVITYNRSVCDESKVFFCPIPFDTAPISFVMGSYSWKSRKDLVALASRKKAGFLCPHGSGWFSKLGIRGLGETWPFSWKSFFSQWLSYQYSLRNNLFEELDLMESVGEIDFDLFGNGWQGGPPIGYLERILIQPKALHSARGVFPGDKYRVLSQYRYSLVIENWVGGQSYVSEKLNESLSVGCIPIYWGDESVFSEYPSSLVIDGRQFKDALDLVSFIRAEPQSSWESRVQLLRDFTEIKAVASATPENFALKFASIVLMYA